MKRNGFTLIELLAVIVITGLIIAITTPKVLEILETSKRETFKLDVAGVVRNLDNQIYNLEIKGQNYQGVYTLENGIIKEVNNFNYSIDRNYNGTITITDNKEIAVAIHSDKFCATKGIGDSNYNILEYKGGICLIPTPESCFVFDGSTGTIKDYLFDMGYLNAPSTAFTNCGFDPVIPEKIGGVSVEVIGTNAFSKGRMNGDPIGSVILPNTLKVIEEKAFRRTNLEKIVIPNGVERIENYAFYENKLTELVIPDSCLYIGEKTFAGNQIENITLPEFLFLGNGVFNDNYLPDNQAFIYKRDSDGIIDNSTLISYGGLKREDVTIPNNVTSIGNLTFNDIGLLSVTIPPSVETIGDSAFLWNQLTNLTIPNSVTNIGMSTFSDNLLTSVIIPSSVISIGEAAFEGNILESISLPNSMTNIGPYAFSNNYLTSVNVPSSVASIGLSAFNKNDFSNWTLTSISYNGTTAHDWNNIINGLEGTPFITGTVISPYGDVTISAN